MSLKVLWWKSPFFPFLGSDLDGDEMVVIWYKPLIFERPHAKPMDYPVYKEKSENNAIQVCI